MKECNHGTIREREERRKKKDKSKKGRTDGGWGERESGQKR